MKTINPSPVIKISNVHDRNLPLTEEIQEELRQDMEQEILAEVQEMKNIKIVSQKEERLGVFLGSELGKGFAKWLEQSPNPLASTADSDDSDSESHDEEARRLTEAGQRERRREPRRTWRLPNSVRKVTSLEAAFAEADYVSINMPYIKGVTHHVISEAVLAQMKPSCHILNFARGEIVDGPALKRLYAKGHAGKYVCDFPDEHLQARRAIRPRNSLWRAIR